MFFSFAPIVVVFHVRIPFRKRAFFLIGAHMCGTPERQTRSRDLYNGMNSRCFKWMRSSLVDLRLLWIFPKLCIQIVKEKKVLFHMSRIQFKMKTESLNRARAQNRHTATATTNDDDDDDDGSSGSSSSRTNERTNKQIDNRQQSNRRITRHFITTIKYAGGFVCSDEKL